MLGYERTEAQSVVRNPFTCSVKPENLQQVRARHSTPQVPNKTLVVKEALRQQAEKEKELMAMLVVPPPSVLCTVTEDEVGGHQGAWMTQSYDAHAKPRSSPVVPPRSQSLQGKKAKFYTDVPDDKQPSSEKRSLSTSNAPDIGKCYVDKTMVLTHQIKPCYIICPSF